MDNKFNFVFESSPAKPPAPKTKAMKYKIFCLETEWSHDNDRLKKKSSVLPLLNYMEESYDMDLPYCFRQVATKSDFYFYLKHLLMPEYMEYKIVYFAFHGSQGSIGTADGNDIKLNKIRYEYPNIFRDKYVHFGSCSTLAWYKSVKEGLKQNSGAKIISGYTKDIGFNVSFIFELWLFCYLSKEKPKDAATLMAAANREMGYFVRSLGFEAY